MDLKSTPREMTIREMCDAFNVTPRTLRFYETKELVFPRRVGNRRLYSRRDRARLKLILRGKRFGFSLEDIRQLLNMYDRDGSHKAQYVQGFALAQNRLREMEQQRDALEAQIAELRAEIEKGRDLYDSYLKQGITPNTHPPQT